jgi:hypothetical protein
MTIFTNRDLERVASLRTNWRKEFLLEVGRLRHERDIAKNRDRLPSADNDRPTSWPAISRHSDRIIP